MSSKTRRHFGLRTLFVAILVVAACIRGGQLIVDLLYPKTDIVGQLVLPKGGPGPAGITIWTQHANGEKFKARTTRSGSFRIRGLEQGQLYTLWIDEDDWVTNALNVEPTAERTKDVGEIKLSKGAIIRMEIIELASGLPPANFIRPVIAMGPGNPEYHMAKSRELKKDGTVEIRVATGDSFALIEDRYVRYPFAGQIDVGSPKILSEGQKVTDTYALRIAGRPELTSLVQNTSNGHWYTAIEFSGSWHQAKTKAEACWFRGMQGHLVTITSKEENDFLVRTFASKMKPGFRSWAAGTDELEEGVWRWDAGPEKGEEFFRAGGQTTAKGFHQWLANEPNNAHGVENVLIWNWQFPGSTLGSWNDERADCSLCRELIVEFSPAAKQ